MKNVTTVRRPKIIEEDISIIVLASNPSYRMKSYGPKSLIKINKNTTLLEYQFNVTKQKFPKSDFVVVTGPETDKIVRSKSREIRLIENQIYDSTNETEQVRLALNNIITNNALIIIGDIYFDFKTLLDIRCDQSSLIVDTSKMLSSNNVGITIIDKKATIMGFGIQPIWGQMIYLTERELKYFKLICDNRERAKTYLFESINVLLQKYPLNITYPLQMEIMKIDSPEKIGRFNENSNR